MRQVFTHAKKRHLGFVILGEAPLIRGLISQSTFWVDKPINPRYALNMQFGKVLRKLRAQRGLGIKKLAPELGVSYSYLSKLENNEVGPSEDMIARVAKYFGYNQNRLLLSAGKVPSDVLRILQNNPDEAIQFLKQRFGSR